MPANQGPGRNRPGQRTGWDRGMPDRRPFEYRHWDLEEESSLLEGDLPEELRFEIERLGTGHIRFEVL